MSGEPHSAHAFGESRDHWWNPDFVELLARRWGLGSARRALDVGSGVGHWGRLLLGVMHPDATLVGVEPEPRWVAAAAARGAAAGLGARAAYRVGSVEDLPFEDASFDFVTCQTVLMHVADAAIALREMWRVLAPGGLLVAAEPNNAVSTLILHSVDWERSVDDIVEDVRGELLRQRGKARCGEGDDSIGDRVPSLFHALGAVDLQVYTSDRTWAALPPYEDALAKAELRELREAVRDGRHYFTREQAREWFVAGGGTEQELARWWDRALARDRAILAAVDDGRYYGPGAGVFYVVSGRKPR
jgi:SAM-dependent methyltransferase